MRPTPVADSQYPKYNTFSSGNWIATSENIATYMHALPMPYTNLTRIAIIKKVLLYIMNNVLKWLPILNFCKKAESSASNDCEEITNNDNVFTAYVLLLYSNYGWNNNNGDLEHTIT